MRSVFDWLDDRTGYRRMVAAWQRRELPRGPSWVYSSAVCLLWLLVVQIVTGFLMMAAYSPSTTTAWASVHLIENSPGGSFLRGVHYFAAQGVIVLFALHLVRILLSAAYRAPRELVWITGLLLMPLILIWAITGNPLANTQKGMAQIDVEGHIIGSTPIVGPIVQRILIGGERVGNLTLTHLYFLHVALLPVLVMGLLVVHIWQVYRHSMKANTAGDRAEADESGVDIGPSRGQAVPYWPYQTVRNLVVTSTVLGTIALLAWWRGAPLEAPADPTITHTPRPEWYFLSLFELRRYFTGNREFIATILVPLAVFGLLVAMPLIDRVCNRRLSLVLRSAIVFAGLGTWGVLTLMPVMRDRRDQDYIASKKQLQELSARARFLADTEGVPPEGAIALLRNDPKTQGPLLFARHCAACHSHVDQQGHGIVAERPSAPNLYGFASRQWIVGLFDPERIRSRQYFGNTSLADGDMASTILTAFEEAETDEQKAELRSELEQVASALSAEARLPSQLQNDCRDEKTIAIGTELMTNRFGCTDCHRFHDAGELGSAPDLTGYGSRDWLVGMISNPEHERFYESTGDNAMPAFAPNQEHPELNTLSEREVKLIADWLRNEWTEPAKPMPR